MIEATGAQVFNTILRLALALLLTLSLPLNASASNIVLPFSFSSGQTLPAASLNSNFQTIYNDYNGNITNFNISASAAIVLSKLDLTSQAMMKRAAGNPTWCAGITTDTQPRISLQSDGFLGFGAGGVSALDVMIKRTDANTLAVRNIGDTLDKNLTAGAITASAASTISSLTLGTPLTVANGGSGLSTTPTNGKVLIGNGTNYTLANLTQGSGITITNGAGSITIASSSSSLVDPGLQGGRLTAISGTAYPTSDTASASTLYFTPAESDLIALYDGSSSWSQLQFIETSLSVPATTNTMYDVFAYSNAGTLALESVAWTNDTTRSVAISYVAGVPLKAGSLTKRLVGSYRTGSSSGQTADSVSYRGVCNVNNLAPRPVLAVDTTNSWTWGSAATWHEANAGSTLGTTRVGIVQSINKMPIRIDVHGMASNNTNGVTSAVGVGIDSTTVNSAQTTGACFNASELAGNAQQGQYRGNPANGYHVYSWLEINSGSMVWFGDNGVTYVQSGLLGEAWM